jgi:hypothetical protein
MEPELQRLCTRWLAAEETEREDDADASFRALARTVLSQPAVPVQFAGTTTAAIAHALAADARRARRVHRALVWGGIAAGVLAAYFGAAPALSLMATGLVASLDGIIRAIVWASSGPDLSAWSVLNGLGRAAAAFVLEPKVTVVMLTIQGIAITALVVLRRLLGSDREFVE